MVEDLTSTAFGADMEEFILTTETPISSQTLPRDRVARPYSKASDCIVIGYAGKRPTASTATVLNPPSTFRFRPMDALIVVGTLPNLHRLQKWIGVTQGR